MCQSGGWFLALRAQESIRTYPVEEAHRVSGQSTSLRYLSPLGRTGGQMQRR